MFRYPEGIQCAVEHLLVLHEDTLHKCKASNMFRPHKEDNVP